MNGVRTTITTLAAAGLLSGGVGAAAAASATTAGATRPPAEHVPRTIHRAEVIYSGTTQGTARTVRGRQATRLITLFDALRPEPPGTVHCDLAGGPTITVTFRGAHHTWVATQSACTNVQVARDGKPLPTLLPTNAWTHATYRVVGR
ncbi:MAG TPA: hypothetical protein VG899_03105 [Mycobacteriales bacterium]|nr:hypothetical protein [Mycobacteriales bacterium]